MSAFIKRFVSILLVVCLLVLFVGCAIVGPSEPQLLTLEEIISSHEGMSFHSGDENMIHYHHYNILKVSDRPLFSLNGQVNQDVLNNLLAILDNPQLDPMLREPKTEWPTGWAFTSSEDFRSITASDFSDFVVPEPLTMSDSGAIAIKLFETIPNSEGVNHGHLTEFTNQWWQLVYRATEEGSDVLTLWMMQPYRLSYFSGTRYDLSTGVPNERFLERRGLPIDDPPAIWEALVPGTYNVNRTDERIVNNMPACDEFFFEANYSSSIARVNLLRDLEHLLRQFDVERYLVEPRNLPGQWQSSYFQTGMNVEFHFYATGEFWSTNPRHQHLFYGSIFKEDGLGATGLVGNRFGRHFSLVNGKDGFSVGPYNGQWPHTEILPTYNDLIWLPSDFETRTMGYDRDSSRRMTVVRYPGNPNSPLRRNTSGEDHSHLPPLRSGLWQLNGFDRAFCAYGLAVEMPRNWETEVIWLRSNDNFAIGSANSISRTGNRYSYGANQLAGMRPGIHLSIAQLVGGDGEPQD